MIGLVISQHYHGFPCGGEQYGDHERNDSLLLMKEVSTKGWKGIDSE